MPSPCCADSICARLMSQARTFRGSSATMSKSCAERRWVSVSTTTRRGDLLAHAQPALRPGR
eukprot:4891069-Prymnesium_polylepis.1